MRPLPPPEADDRSAVDDRVATRARPRLEPVPLLLCGLVAIVGAVLPWASVSASFIDPVHKAGIDGDGRITLLLGVVVALLGLPFLARPGRTVRWAAGLALVTATAILIIALVNMADVGSAVGPLTPEARALLDAEVGVGLWLTLVAGLAGVTGSILALIPRTAGG